MAVAFREAQLPKVIDRKHHVKISANNGGSLSFKRDEKSFLGNGGGFNYCRSEDRLQNRSICWQTTENILELTELCLDYNIHGNCLVLEFEGEVLLPQIFITELAEKVVVLVASTCCVYRFIFSHPGQGNQGLYFPSSLEVSVPSIFYRAKSAELQSKENVYTLPQTCRSFSATCTRNGSSYFAMISETQTVLLVKMPPPSSDGGVEVTELKYSSIMSRLWSGLVPTVFRGEGSSDAVLCSTFYETGKILYLVTLCKDLKLRIWHCETHDCTNVIDVVPFIPDNVDSQQGIAQAFMIKRNVDLEALDQFVTIFLNFAFQSEFIVFAVEEKENGIDLKYEQRFFSEKASLQDFSMTSRQLWTLWAKHDGNSEAQVVALASSPKAESDWHPVYLSQSETEPVFVPSHREPKEVYLEAVFFPGRFSKASIIKAMQITVKRSGIQFDFSSTSNLKLSELRDQVIHLMDVEVLRNAVDFEAEAMEYSNLQLQCWSSFYGSIVQYDQVERRALGIFASSQDGQVTIVHQNYTGYVYPLDWIEYLYLSDVDTFPRVDEEVAENVQGCDKRLARDLVSLMESVKAVRTQFPPEVFHNVEILLEQGDDVVGFMDNLMESILTNKSDDELLIADSKFKSNFLRDTELRLQRIILHSKCIKTILTAIDNLLILPDTQEEKSGLSLRSLQFCGAHTGSSFISKIMSSKAEIRKNICRDLIPILKILVRLSGRVGLDLRSSNIVNSDDIPTVCDKLYSFFSIVWIGRQVCEPGMASMEENMRHLAALELSESPELSSRRLIPGDRNSTLLEQFIAHAGIPTALKFLEMIEKSVSEADGSWSSRLNILVNALMNAVWPCGPGTAVAEFLLCQGQYSALGDHLLRLQNWCKFNKGSNLFLRGQAYLGSRQFAKALECFVKGAEYVDNEEDLFTKILPSDCESKRDMIVHYFMKVLRLFEQFNSSDMVVVVASTALAVAKKSDPNVPILLSNIFKHHLELGHNKEAYAAITQNPDNSRRRDCLHHFIVTLCERKQLKEICEFPFIGMEEEVINIIKTRARTVDITVNRYYDLLYAFHIYKADYCRAAGSMYEYACRLRLEMHGVTSLQKQAKCFLAAINCLKIIDPNYAWIVKPKEKRATVDIKQSSHMPNRSPKRREDGEEIDQHSFSRKSTRKTEIVEILDLEKEYTLLLAKLKLLQREPDGSTSIIGPNLSAEEAVALLSQAGMFDMAFTTALAFKLALEPIFEGLAATCVQITQQSVQGELTEEAWECLLENDVKSGKSASSASDQMWELMKSYLVKYTSPPNALYYRPVARKLFSLGCTPPVWFINMYKQDNPAELLRLYICYDMLEEAAAWTTEYIDAVLGLGKEYFGLKSALHVNTPSVWLPYNAIDQLLEVLCNALEDPKVIKIYKDLKLKLEVYHGKVESISQDKIQLGLSRKRLGGPKDSSEIPCR